MFRGRNLVIATKHEKEKVIAPILERALGVNCIITKDLDTDQLGTFTGEIERKEDPINTARKKCYLAMELTKCDLAIASEGSFGAHPSLYFVPVDDEFLVFIDKKNGLEIIARELSTETNFSGSEINNLGSLLTFTDKVKFPSHGIILRKSKEDFSEIIKGITNTEYLTTVFEQFINKYGTVYIETDMRAMYNPTRMKIIEQLTQKIAEKINSLCPKCKSPGFGITEAKKGLPCEICNYPTKSTLSYIHSCQKCEYINEKIYPNGKRTEDPMYCDICNP
jgi:Zn finger protein HypA/HybF involved in hydrogenase expression